MLFPLTRPDAACWNFRREAKLLATNSSLELQSGLASSAVGDRPVDAWMLSIWPRTNLLPARTLNASRRADLLVCFEAADACNLANNSLSLGRALTHSILRKILPSRLRRTISRDKSFPKKSALLNSSRESIARKLARANFWSSSTSSDRYCWTSHFLLPIRLPSICSA